MILKLKRNKSTIILKGIAFLLVGFFITSPAYPGKNCGSNEGISKYYKDNSSDWWPDFRFYSAAGILITPIGYVATFCSLAGGAYFGNACAWHDECYEGKVGLGMNKKECDLELLYQWRHACNKKYSSKLLFLCRENCETTAEGMHKVLSSSPEAWINARSERENNITILINDIYIEVFGRDASKEELQLSKDYLKSTKSVKDLRLKVKKSFADRMSFISIIIPLLID